MSAAEPSTDRIPITVVLYDESGRVACFSVDADQRVDDVKAILEANWGTPMSSLILAFKGRVLDDHERLNVIGVAAHGPLDRFYVQLNFHCHRSGTDMVRAELMPATNPANLTQLTLANQASMLREQIRMDPRIRGQLNRENPAVVQAALNDDPAVFEMFLVEQNAIAQQARDRENQRIAAISSDPFNEEHQRYIEDQIRQANVQINMEAALEHNPEAFASVCMLYVKLLVNNKSVTAFVDSGAQSTIMTLQCAERLGIAHLIDRRFKGIAKGVGKINIVGRIHYVEVRLGSHYIAVTLTILESGDVEFLWGLDMLKKHLMCIDLQKNCLRFGDEEVTFLDETELPNWVRHVEAKKTSQPSSPTATSSIRPPAVAIAPQTTITSAASETASASISGTSSTPIGAPSVASSASNSAAGQFNEEDISLLVGLGFTRDRAIMALRTCGGNVDIAASWLFQ